MGKLDKLLSAARADATDRTTQCQSAVHRLSATHQLCAFVARELSAKFASDEVGELLGMSGRHFRRLIVRYDEEGAEGSRDRRLGKPPPRRVPAAELSRVQIL